MYIPIKYFKFLRNFLNGSVVHRKEYSFSQKRNSCTVFYVTGSDRNVGHVDYFLKCCSCNFAKDLDDSCDGQFLAKMTAWPCQQSPNLHADVSDAKLVSSLCQDCRSDFV